MASNPDYIPPRDADFDGWYFNLKNYVVEKTQGPYPPYQWTNIPPERVTELTTLYDDWHTKYNTTLAAHTPVDTEYKNDARKAAVKYIRSFVAQYLKFDPVTDEDRTAMGIHNHNPKPTPVPIPKTVPELTIDSGTPRCLIINYRDKDSERRAKPAGVHGIEIRWAISDAPPADVEDLINSSFDTKSPLTLEFKEHERGKKVYLCGRWEINREGEKGHFGDVVEAFVP
jgi:hypothetical protein